MAKAADFDGKANETEVVTSESGKLLFWVRKRVCG